MKARRKGWGVAEAKARFSSLIERALTHGPQEITRHGRKHVFLVSAADWESKSKRKGSLVDFFAASPLRGSSLKVRRAKGKGRAISL